MSSVFRWLLVVSVILGLSLSPALVQAQPVSNIVVDSATHHNAYPASIKFQLRAHSTADITQAKLTYRILGNPASTYAYPENLVQGTSIDVAYELNTQKTYLPPEVEIRYYWDIEDAAGHRLRTDPVTFTVTDTRFQWRKIEDDSVSLLWYNGDEAFANDLLSLATKALDQLASDAGIEPKQMVKILAYASQSDLLGALEPGAHEWTGGRSFSSESIVAIAIPTTASGRAFAARAVPHELSHVVIHQATDNPFGGIPQWLNEGLAMYSEGEVEETYQRALNSAIRNNSLLSLKTLSSNFPADPQQATLSYAESYSVVKFIIDKYGRDKMAQLLDIFGQGSTYDDATRAALGMTVDDLEREWRATLGQSQPTTEPATKPNAESTAIPVGATTPVQESSAKQNQPCGALPLTVVALLAVLAIKRH